MSRFRRTIAPRLASGDRRERVYAAWPPDVKAGLRSIARMERKSMNWVVEQTVIRFFRLDKPEYVPTAKPKLKLVRRRA